MLTLVKKVQEVAKCRSRKYLRSLTPLALLLSLSWTRPSHAQTRLGLTCVGSVAGSTINFAFQFGDGPWRPTSVRHRSWRGLEYWYEFPNQNSGPTLRVRFDADISSGTYYVTQTLSQYAVRYSNCNAGGRKYYFYRRGNRIYLESLN